MRLNRIELENFRGFEWFSLDLHPEFTLLLGRNGAGKSALLEAVAVALGEWFTGLTQVTGQNHYIRLDDVRRVRSSPGGMPTVESVFPVRVTAEAERDGEGGRGRAGRGVARVRLLRDRAALAAQARPTGCRRADQVPDERLSRVPRSGLVDLQDGRSLPFHLLSDGYRNLVAIAADLAWRAVQLNPHLKEDAARRARGVVLIDEIDLHLHPTWQRRVLGDLRKAFPGIQFIATTHSPQVLSTAQADWVRLLEPGRDHALPVSRVRGRDTNALLEDVFGESARPALETSQLDELAQFIDAGQLEEARALLARLTVLLGEADEEIVRAEWGLREKEEELRAEGAEA